MDNCLQKVIQNINIEEGKEAVINTLINIYFKEGISTKELAKSNLLPIPLVTAIKKEFIKQEILLQDRGVRLTSKGKDFVEKELGFYGLNKELYMKLCLEPWKEHKEIKEVKEELGEIFMNRPQADVTIDQSKCTLDTAINRAVLCLKNSSLIGKRVLCVGDDDLVSIALGFLLKKLFADIKYSKTSILVLDIDERILDYINKIAKEQQLPVKSECIDLRKSLPQKLRGKYDCFFTDPPYTLQGMNLFLSRGIEALKYQCGLNVFLSYAHKSPEVELAMQKNFVAMGLRVSEILTSFNAYDGAGIIGGVGQMIVLKTTNGSKPLIEEYYDDPIYTGELKVTVRLYKCKNCGEAIKVGTSEYFKIIEELKEKGCIKCHGKLFDLVHKETKL